MRRDWFRFDPATLLAVLLVGLVPPLLLVLISYLYLQAMTFPLYDLVRAPHRQHVIERCAELDHAFRAWQETLATALLNALEPPPLPGPVPTEPEFRDADLIDSLTQHVGAGPAADPEVLPRSIREPAEAILASIAHDGRASEPAWAALTALPVALEDPMGFSYAVEAAVARRAPLPSEQEVEFLRAAATLDVQTVQAYRDACGDAIRVTGLPVPVRFALGTCDLAPGGAELSANGALRLAVATNSGGVLACEVRADELLPRLMERLDRHGTAAPGAFVRLEPIRLNADTPSPESAGNAGDSERVWAERPLAMPFQDRWQLVSGSRGTEALNPLVFLNRLEGIHYLWGGVGVLALCLVGSLFLAGVVARRVELSRRKDTFLRLVSHELRTPISSISMLAETLALRRVRDEDEQQLFLRQMQAETVRLGDLVERVLEFGRSSSGRAGAREVVTDPGELVEDVVRRFRERVTDGHEVALRNAQTFHPVLLDRDAIGGVVMNLLSNAQKHSPQDTAIEVTVGEESRHLFVQVRDHGSGIRRRDLRRIFRPFERGSVGAGAPGFGLGLAYCREVASQHGGKIRVRSRVGEGSSFTLEIPLVRRRRGQAIG
ncbi:MAG: sensor histidine kinase [Planctomycetota bacterium]